MSRHWYRYHQLFGELLRAELRRSEPDLVADLHRRAANWFKTEGLIDEALRHLIAAGDIARCADLIVADWVDEFNGLSAAGRQPRRPGRGVVPRAHRAARGCEIVGRLMLPRPTHLRR